jgi:hypothetical protein
VIARIKLPNDRRFRGKSSKSLMTVLLFKGLRSVIFYLFGGIRGIRLHFLFFRMSHVMTVNITRNGAVTKSGDGSGLFEVGSGKKNSPVDVMRNPLGSSGAPPSCASSSSSRNRAAGTPSGNGSARSDAQIGPDVREVHEPAYPWRPVSRRHVVHHWAPRAFHDWIKIGGPSRVQPGVRMLPGPPIDILTRARVAAQHQPVITSEGLSPPRNRPPMGTPGIASTLLYGALRHRSSMASSAIWMPSW